MPRRPGGNLLALGLALVLLALFGSSAQARTPRERSPQAAALAESTKARAQEERAAARAQRAAERLAKREAASQARREAASKARREAAASRARRTAAPIKRTSRVPANKHRPQPGNEREKAVVVSTCTGVTWLFRKFPAMPNNTVKERLQVAKFAKLFSWLKFDGSTSLTYEAINAAPGKHGVDTHARWKTNGTRGGFDIHTIKTCPPAPALTIEKLQKIEGSGGSFTTSPLMGKAGQTVDYEIVVQDTGNVPLTLSNFTDPKCDAGTISGGPGATPLQPGATPSTGGKTTYLCKHLLGSASSYTNTATVTGTPPSGAGSPITETSNTVVVNLAVPEPAFAIQKLQQIEGGGGAFTTSTLKGEVGQTIDYKIVVQNTGNVPLKFGALSDPNCDSGTISGGPGSGALAVGESTTYTCKHLLSTADQSAGSYSNTAADTGTPEGGSPITHTSNTVVVTLPAPPTPPHVYLAYADTPSPFPSPWRGGAGVVWDGCGYGGVDQCPMTNGQDIYDSGAIRIDAPATGESIEVSSVTVVIGSCTYHPWPNLNQRVEPGQKLILAQTTSKPPCASPTAESAGQDNFDTSESYLFSSSPNTPCANDKLIPEITLTINGKTTTLMDTGQVLNTGGGDSTCEEKFKEPHEWIQIQ